MKPILEGTITNNSELSDYIDSIKILIEPDNHYFQNLENDRRCYDKLILFNGMEPMEINNIRDNIIRYHRLFDKIYSYDEVVLKYCPNSERYAFGSCWVLTDSSGNVINSEKDFGDFYKISDKKFKVSFIKSIKNQLPGHQLRHNIPQLLNNRPFEIYYPVNRIDHKHILFVDSMYHISVENSKHDNYFTEKLIDCFMSKTIPIYWGCPNIGEYFNRDGMILVDTLEDIDKYLSDISTTYYQDRLKIIDENYEKAKDYAFFYTRLDNLIKNNI